MFLRLSLAGKDPEVLRGALGYIVSSGVSSSMRILSRKHSCQENRGVVIELFSEVKTDGISRVRDTISKIREKLGVDSEINECEGIKRIVIICGRETTTQSLKEQLQKVIDGAARLRDIKLLNQNSNASLFEVEISSKCLDGIIKAEENLLKYDLENPAIDVILRPHDDIQPDVS